MKRNYPQWYAPMRPGLQSQPKRSRSSRRAQRRRLLIERLDQRQLLAGDLMMGSEGLPPGGAMVHHSGFTVTDSVVETHHDRVPRFGADPTVVAVADGYWSDPATWSIGIPDEGDVVAIPAGVSVIYDVDSEVPLDVIEVGGRLDFDPGIDTSLWLNELMVLPHGVLTVGTADAPIHASVDAEIVFTDEALKTDTIDPQQFGNGLLVFGTAVMHGSELEQTFTRLTDEVSSGDTTVRLDGSLAGWQVGDEIVFPDTRQINPVDNPGYYTYQPHYETRVITAVDGDVITVDTPLSFDHVGPRDADGSYTVGFEDEVIMPHVGNLTRNVTLRSENPDGVRGHTVIFGSGTKDWRYVALEEMGRTEVGAIDSTTFDESGEVTHVGTNQVARYSDHLHHVYGPVDGIDVGGDRYQWVSIGNSITGARKWGTAIHNSHFGLVSDSVYYDSDGAAIVTEDGSEYGNLIENNFVVRVNGGGGKFSAVGVHRTPGFVDGGDLGDGIWLAGPMNSIRGNVVANAIRNAYIVITDHVPAVGHGSYRPVSVPLVPGRNHHVEGSSRTVNLLEVAFDDFVGNEAYGATTAAVWVWSVGDRTLFPDATGRNTLVDTTAWHVSGSGVYFYYANDHVIDGWIQRGDSDVIGRRVTEGGSPLPGTAMTHGGSIAATSEVRRADVQGMEVGFHNRGRQISDEILIEDSYFDNGTNFINGTWSQNPLDGSRDMIVRNVVLGDDLYPGATQSLVMNYREGSEHLLIPETTLVEDFNGWSGVDLDVYYKEQAPGFQIPSHLASHAVGLTNIDAWETYGIAIGGRVAPSLEQDGDNGDAALVRGRAMGIEGLVFEATSASIATPRLVANVVEEFGVPTMYYTVIGDDASVSEVTFSLDGDDFVTALTSGRVPLEGMPLAATIRLRGTLSLDGGASGLGFDRELRLPIRPVIESSSNSRPELTITGDPRVTANASIALVVSAADPDGESTVLSAQDLPAGSDFDPATGLFAWTPSNVDTGEHVLEFVATDERGKQAVQEVTVIVSYDFSLSPVLGQWSLDDGGAFAADASQNEIDGDIVGAFSHPAGGLQFDGMGDRVELPVATLLKPESELTVELWVTPEGRGDFNDLLVFNSGSASAYLLAVKDGGSGLRQGYHFAITTEIGRFSLQAPRTEWRLGVWDHVVATFDSSLDGGTIRLYVNGSLVTATSNVGSRIKYKPHGSQTVTFGGSDGGERDFTGGLSNVQISAVAIVPTDVTSRFESGRSAAIATALAKRRARADDFALAVDPLEIASNVQVRKSRFSVDAADENASLSPPGIADADDDEGAGVAHDGIFDQWGEWGQTVVAEI